MDNKNLEQNRITLAVFFIIFYLTVFNIFSEKIGFVIQNLGMDGISFDVMFSNYMFLSVFIIGMFSSILYSFYLLLFTLVLADLKLNNKVIKELKEQRINSFKFGVISMFIPVVLAAFSFIASLMHIF